jgi:hypothetical protein
LETFDPWEGDDGEELDAEIMRTDWPFGAELRGTTAEEALADESLDQVLARERPGRPPTDEALSLLDDVEPDVEGELVSEGTFEEDAFASPELGGESYLYESTSRRSG